nr:GNAT family N-acetyltransferase [Tissierella sp.]
MKTLTTKRLILRQWQVTDLDDLYEYAKSDLVGPNAGWAMHKSKEESKEIIEMFIKSGEIYAIVLKEEDKVIGSIGLHDRKSDISIKEMDQREVGYVLNPNYWGKGIMPEAVDRVVEYGFKELYLDLITCCHYDFNNNSKRVIEKCGFKYKFEKKEKLKALDDKEVTTLCYIISKEDYIELCK